MAPMTHWDQMMRHILVVGLELNVMILFIWFSQLQIDGKGNNVWCLSNCCDLGHVGLSNINSKLEWIDDHFQHLLKCNFIAAHYVPTTSYILLIDFTFLFKKKTLLFSSEDEFLAFLGPLKRILQISLLFFFLLQIAILVFIYCLIEQEILGEFEFHQK